MTRKSVQIGESEYPLDHLQSFRVVVDAKDPLTAPTVLLVTFSCHVFTEKWADGMDEARRYVERGEQRAFCPIRHRCAINLPELVRYHIGGKAFTLRDGNGIMNHFFHAEADGVPYPIFFRLARATRIAGVDGILHVISAYQHPRLPPRNRLQAVKFARLVHSKCPPAGP